MHAAQRRVGLRKQELDAEVRAVAEADSTRAQAEALAERAEALLKQRVIEQLPEIVRAAAEPLSRIQNMTVISSDDTNQLGENVAGQVATSTKIIKDLVGIDIGELINGKVVGEATGVAVAKGMASSASPRRKNTES
jgi:flotillin